MLEVIKPGLFTTVQDLGRHGYQQYGMVVGGAMDSFALRIGNVLVGNEENAAGLEMTMIGPILHIQKDCLIAITGGDLSPQLNGRPVPMWKSIVAPKGSELRFGQGTCGIRSYLAIRGGIDVPEVMGSRSTYVKAGIGGFQGRPLQKGDVLSVYTTGGERLSQVKNRRLHPHCIPRYESSIVARVIPGPQHDWFQRESLEAFFREPYTITPQSDRMGYRLAGKKLLHTGSADIITDAIALGAIQVPASGQPILLMADRQTTGGYPKIATVISVDLSLVAQAKPGDQIRFTPITVEESHRLLFEREQLIQQLKLANENMAKK